MSEITIKYPPEFERAVNLTKDELESHIRLMAALKMFELGKISSGKAAEFVGVSRVEFFEIYSRYKVSIFNYSENEIEDEMRSDLENFERVEKK